MNNSKKSKDFLNSGENVYFYRHKDSLIDWNQWDTKSMEKAKNQNKLLFIHIGHVASYWCINKTDINFEYTSNVANFINENFIPILVDKDERPDLERYYSNIIQEVDQLSNWPIICFALFDGTPVFGTTYLTPDQLLDVSQNVLNTFTDDPLSVLEVAKDLSDSLFPTCGQPKDYECSFSERDIHMIVEPWKRKFDKKNGGTLYPPKYPLVAGKEFLLEYAYHYNDKDILDHLKLTLDKMSNGGIYDHVNGGFFHYTKDTAWRKPFFEKHLVDNAVSVGLYAKMYQYMPAPIYKKFIEETLQFCMRHLLAIDGGFHTAIQADSLGREAIYYTWTVEEFREILGEDASLAISYYGLKRYGKQPYRNVLYVNSSIQELSHKFGLSEKEVEERLTDIKGKLIKAFNLRIILLPDEKVIAYNNAAIANAFIEGYKALGYEEYLLFAGETLRYLSTNLMTDEGKLYHFICNEMAEGDGFLNDYAETIDAFINMYLIDGEEQWIFYAKRLADYAIQNFFDPEIKMFLYCERTEKYNKVQTMPVADGAFASSGSIMMHNLVALGLFFKDDNYRIKASQMMCNMKDQLPGSGPYCANWARLLFRFVRPHYLIAVVGPDAEEVAGKYFSHYHADIDIAFVNKESKLPLFKDIKYDPNSTVFYMYKEGKFEKKSTEFIDLDLLSHIPQ